METIKTKLPKDVKIYFDKIRASKNVVNKERHLLIEYLDKVFKTEKLFYSDEQIEKYFSYEKYFPHKLFEWERFLFVLHYCIFREDGLPRWSDLFIYMGRGGGKNYFLAWEAWCAISPTNNIPKYHFDICATSEEQAKQSFDDLYDILENNTKYRKLFEINFEWTKERITCKKTNSTIRYRTNNAKSKDGLRPGAVAFDEYHAYVNYDNINVFTTALGKVPHPRTIITTTDGEVRDGPLDKLLERSLDILNGRIDDNGLLPFICKLDDEKEVNEPAKWEKANPSLEYLPSLFQEMKKEYANYQVDSLSSSSFIIKRMNMPQKIQEAQVTSWDNIEATGKIKHEDGSYEIREVPDLTGKSCVCGIDMSQFADFASVCLTFKENDTYYCVKHTWICSQSADLPRIKPPLKEWERHGYLTFIDDVEIDSDVIANWIYEQRKKYNILKVAFDSYKSEMLKNSLRRIGFDIDDKEHVLMVRPSNIMLVVSVISSAFNTRRIVWGDDPLMRWATWNAKLSPRVNNNYVYEKIEPKSRKTDPFMAFVHSMCLTLDTQLEGGTSSYIGSIRF